MSLLDVFDFILDVEGTSFRPGRPGDVLCPLGMAINVTIVKIKKN